MPADPHDRPAPRARPVADAPLPAGGEQMEAMARRWALELLAERPLADAASLPLEEMAARAPGLCEQILRALGSERETDRLLGLALAGEGGRPHDFAADLLACAGVTDAQGALRAVESLRGAVWQHVEEALPAAEARLAAPLGDRLAHVCLLLLGEALAEQAAASPTIHAPAAPGQAHDAPRHVPAAPSGSRRVVILDEHLDAEPGQAAEPGPAPSPGPPGPPRPPERAEAIEVHDRRREEGPAAWIGSIGGQLERFEQDGRPFAVLLLDMTGADDASLPGHLDQLEAALAAELARAEPAASLTKERPGRCWIVAPGADRGGAEALAGHLEAALLDPARRLGVSAAVSVGIAVCPEDGRRASALAAHADIGLYASRWQARSSVRGESL